MKRGAAFNRLQWVVIWIWTATFLEMAYLVALLSADGRACGGDGGSPYAASGSQAAQFCSTWVDWTSNTDPVSIAVYTMLPSLTLGAIGIWRRSRLVLGITAGAELMFIVWLIHAAQTVDLGR